MNREKYLHATCELGIGIGIIFGTFMFLEYKPLTRAYLQGIEKGRAEATSNLVAAVNSLTDKSRNEIFLRVTGVVNNEEITPGEKKGYISSSFDNIMQIERVRREISQNAKFYSSGEKKVDTNETFTTPDYEIKINLNKEITKW
jgi:hypothetical protein